MIGPSRNIEASTRQRVTMAQLPTFLDVQAKRTGLTATSISEAIVAGESEPYRVVVESLSENHDLMEIAMAAIQGSHSVQRMRGLAL